MGDHARREMIVRIVKATRQNPAYRPFAASMTTSDENRRRLFFSSQGTYTMRFSAGRHLLIAFIMGGCGSSASLPPAVPTPVSPATTPITNVVISWNFSLAPGGIAYRISRNAVIESTSDSNSRREVSTNSTYESITLQQPTNDTIFNFSASVDTFTTATQGAAEPVQAASLPLQLSGTITGDTIHISSDSLTEKCSPVMTALITDLHNLIPRLPSSLAKGTSWRDSTTAGGCQGSIPTRSRILRIYTVVGESSFENAPILIVQRADTIQAEGEGAQQQHRLQLAAQGVGSATYYVDTKAGRIVHLTVNQDLDLTITASGRASHFKQGTKQEFVLVH
jgi:hypothetical protein